MKKIYIPFVALLALLISTVPLQAQLFEDFETGDKGSYAGASVTLESGDWYLDDALIDGLTNDKFNGNQSVRTDRRNGRTGNFYMEFDYPNGADELSFYLAHYGNFAEDAALQVQYSVDGGSSWTNLGDEITAPADLTQYTLPVEIDGNIRFKFIQSSGTDRMNVDDIRITDYIEPTEEPSIAVSVDGKGVESGGELSFAATSTSGTKTKVIGIKNLGNQELVISEVSVQGAGYSISSDLADSTLSFDEEAEVELTFSPGSEGAFQGQFQVQSNASNQSSFTLNISGEGFADDAVMPISQARQVDYGTRVTIAGRVTVANQFAGPVHVQDESGAIAVYYNPLHTAVEIGDSVEVSGPVYYPPFASDNPEDFAMQITTTPSDNNVSYEIFDVEEKELEPKQITIQQLNTGDFEGQLVLITDIAVDHSGSLQGESSYDISDQTGSSILRIDADTNIPGASLPEGLVNIVGVVDKFSGNYQIKPRFTEDLGVEALSYPGDDVSRDLTFEIVTWSIEWFGDGSNGPDDDDQQLRNVIEVIREIDAEIYAFQEISDQSDFATLLDSLDEYGGILADFTQSQKTAFLFKRSEIDSLSSAKITESMTSNYWAGGNNDSFARFPLMFQFNATIGGESREIYAFNVHMKAMDDADSYNQRDRASQELKLYLDQLHSSDNVIFIGDYNDTVTGSITPGEESPYENFVNDEEYTVITQSLEERGFASQSIGSFIDHITITSELMDEYIPGTERVENTNYIGSYLSSTSDHYPIWTRFQFETVVSNEEGIDNPVNFSLNQNYPNPFNPSTVISYQLAENSTVTLKVYDMLGREVATLVNNERMSSGSYDVTFDAANLSSGLYMYRLSTVNGQQITKKMMLVK